ncbi:MAG: putative glycosyl transferase [Phenylobacterium sp.]|nr:putative glycosyl transferase [Phenylobacterium sp.]
MAALVSVIMPCFNAGARLRPALESALGQTWPDLEIIFVDNNSSDGSLEAARQVLAGAGRPFQTATCPAQGVNHARNHGYGLATGDFIQWLDADDELAADKIALQVAALEARPDADIAYGDWIEQRFSPLGPRPPRRHDLAQVDDQVARTLATVWYPPHLYLLRRAAADRLQAAQAWQPGRPVATDIEYSALAALTGLKFLHVKGAEATYNIWSDSQISGSTPYRLRAETHAAIFARLKDTAPGPGVTLTPRHRLLLDQDWDSCWRLPRNAVAIEKLPGRRVRLRRRETGKTLEVRPRDAAIVQALMNMPVAMLTCHLALMLADTVPEVGGDPATGLEALQRLQAQGFLDRVAFGDGGPPPG